MQIIPSTAVHHMTNYAVTQGSSVDYPYVLYFFPSSRPFAAYNTMVDYENVETPRNPAVTTSTNGVIIQRRSSVIKEVPRYETEDAKSENYGHEGDNTPQAPRESQSEGTKARPRRKRKTRVADAIGNEDWDQNDDDDGGDEWKLAEKKRHKCPNCYMRFKKPSALVIHMRTHSGEKPYKCKQCTKRFSISGNLRRHMFTHTGEKPYKCLACGRAFNNPSHLARHSKKIHI